MNCAVHTDTAAVAYCRTCGKAMCNACRRDVRGVIYCEDCIASRLHEAAPPVPPPPTAVPPRDPSARVPSPGLAAVLGFIPGVGAMYNGQFMKGFIHVLIFASLIWAADRSGFFGIFIPFFIFYMVLDAYKTAHALELGLPVPDPFGLEQALGGGRPVPPPPPVAAANPGDPVAVVPPGPAPAANDFTHSNAPIGAVVLIILGLLFLLDNVGIFQFHWIGRLWPIILIVIGAWLFARRWNVGRPA
jgi:TM2 domain-containing membrane protein YozV